MRWFRDLRVLLKLLIAPAVSILALIALALTAYAWLSAQEHAIVQLYSQDFKNQQAVAGFITRIGRIHANIYKVTSLANSTDDTKTVETLGTTQMAAIDALVSDIGAWTSVHADAHGSQDGDGKGALPLLEEYKKHCAGVVDLATVDVGMASTYMTLAEKTFQAASKALDGLLARQDSLAQQKYEHVMATSRETLTVFAVVFLVAAGMVLLVNLGITRLIVVPIGQTQRFIEGITEGNLSDEVAVRSRDEIGRMCDCLNDFVAKLRAVVQGVSDKANFVATSSGELSKTSDGLSLHAAAQAQEAAELSRSVSEIASSTEEVAKSVASMSEFVHSIRDQASDGGAVVGQAIEGIKTAAQSVGSAAETLSGLSASSREIGQVITVIEDIADQTNLLALNAAIEAARAGEHGRGFAVVADEVRKLAEKTVRATKQISDIVSAIQKNSDSITRSVSRGVGDVSKGVGLADQAGGALRDILKGIEQIGVMMDQIASASEQQSTTIAAMTDHIASVAETAKAFAGGMKETAGAAASLDQVSNTLRADLSFFKT